MELDTFCKRRFPQDTVLLLGTRSQQWEQLPQPGHCADPSLGSLSLAYSPGCFTRISPLPSQTPRCPQNTRPFTHPWEPAEGLSLREGAQHPLPGRAAFHDKPRTGSRSGPSLWPGRPWCRSCHARAGPAAPPRHSIASHGVPQPRRPRGAPRPRGPAAAPAGRSPPASLLMSRGSAGPGPAGLRGKRPCGSEGGAGGTAAGSSRGRRDRPARAGAGQGGREGRKQGRRSREGRSGGSVPRARVGLRRRGSGGARSEGHLPAGEQRRSSRVFLLLPEIKRCRPGNGERRMRRKRAFSCRGPAGSAGSGTPLFQASPRAQAGSSGAGAAALTDSPRSKGRGSWMPCCPWRSTALLPAPAPRTLLRCDPIPAVTSAGGGTGANTQELGILHHKPGPLLPSYPGGKRGTNAQPEPENLRENAGAGRGADTAYPNKGNYSKCHIIHNPIAAVHLEINQPLVHKCPRYRKTSAGICYLLPYIIFSFHSTMVHTHPPSPELSLSLFSKRARAHC